jgi:hypothetical protein
MMQIIDTISYQIELDFSDFEILKIVIRKYVPGKIHLIFYFIQCG